MKYRLEFEVQEDEYDRLSTVLQAEPLLAAIQDFSNWLREQIKYADKDYDEVREKFFGCLKDRGIEDIW